jgi:soluble lytic murein transglycosylase-like protein
VTDDDPGAYANRLSAHLVRRPGRLMVACLATVLGPAVVAQAGAMTAAPAAKASPSDAVGMPVPGDRDTWLAVAKQAAATCPGLPSSVLLAIGHVESSLGVQTWTSSAGAVGPMQFLPSTWAAYGVDGDGDGSTDIMNPVDALHGAARLLCANGGGDPDRLASALWNYNHSEEYVRQVLAISRLTPV